MAIAPAFPFNEDLGLLLLALSTPHILYFFTWTCTGAFTRVAKTVGVEAFTLFYKVRLEGGEEGDEGGWKGGTCRAFDQMSDVFSYLANFSICFPLYIAVGVDQVCAVGGPHHVGHEGTEKGHAGAEWGMRWAGRGWKVEKIDANAVEPLTMPSSLCLYIPLSKKGKKIFA
eukprot:evm.model.NODE_28793_length_12468_cov_13.197305.4